MDFTERAASNLGGRATVRQTEELDEMLAMLRAAATGKALEGAAGWAGAVDALVINPARPPPHETCPVPSAALRLTPLPCTHVADGSAGCSQ